MTADFPLAISGATSIYLGLSMITWLVHFFLVAAVLGGAVLSAVDALVGGDPTLERRVAADRMSHSLPLLLGLAITAGVAPFLFAQILYKHAFYTAHLLLFVRFLAILPALLVCFYLLYFARSARVSKWSARARAAIWFVAAAAGLFVGYSFVELHSLSIEPARWVPMYAEKSHVYLTGSVVLRALAFAALAVAMVPVAMVLVGQFFERARTSFLSRRLAAIGALAAPLAVTLTVVYARGLGAGTTELFGGGLARVHFVVFGCAALVHCAILGGVALGRLGPVRRLRIALQANTVVLLWAVAALREVVRADRLDLASRSLEHQDSLAGGGTIAYAIFALINVAAVVWCLTRVTTQAEQASDSVES